MYDDTPLASRAELLAREFPRQGEGVFLNTAAQGILPQRTLAAMAEFERGRQYPNRIDDDHLAEIERTCRERVAALVGAPARQIGLATNTSDGINIAALHLPLGPGDCVLVPRGEFPANVYPWLALRRNGVETVFHDTEGAHLAAEEVAARLDRDPRIRAVAVSLVQFSNGHRNPVEAIGRACRERGVFFVIDGIQGIGAVPFDWAEARPDFLACGGQKWLCAPWGSGFFVAAEWLCREVEPVRAGWLQVAGARKGGYGDLCRYDLAFLPDATRFEVGTYAYTALLGLSTSADLLLTVGIDRIRDHARTLLQPLEQAIEERGARHHCCSSAGCRSSILCFGLGDEGATRDLHVRFVQAGIACAFREGAIRIAPHVYNTPDDIARTIHAMAAVGLPTQRLAAAAEVP
ncbi:aminotransferase class V-fold PLP-dependent enzyme [soil metagenome]